MRKDKEKDDFYNYYEKCSATFDIFEVIRSGDVLQVRELLNSRSLDEMLDEVIIDIHTARTTFICSAAVYYAQILLYGVPINDCISILTSYTSLPYLSMSVNEIREQIARMIYDYTEAVGNCKKHNTENYSKKTNSAIQYIHNHIYDKIYIKDIADTCQASVSGIQHVFKEDTGLTLVSYVKRTKLEKAAQLLSETDIPCIEISDKLSFTSQSYFNTCFKSIFGCTPLQYRNTVAKL